MRQLIQRYLEEQRRKKQIQMIFEHRRRALIENAPFVRDALCDALRRDGWRSSKDFRIEAEYFEVSRDCFIALLSEPLYSQYFEPYLKFFGLLNGYLNSQNSLLKTYTPYLEENQKGLAAFLQYITTGKQ